jgi:hypothetical protein
LRPRRTLVQSAPSADRPEEDSSQRDLAEATPERSSAPLKAHGYPHRVAHSSDSAEQRAAEPEILRLLAAKLNTSLAPETLQLPGGARVDVDGVDPDRRFFVEVFAHQGRLKGGQIHKVARDALKLITVGREHPDARLIIAFGDVAAAAGVVGKSWLAEALRTWHVETFVAEISDLTRDALLQAQTRQVMVNVVPDEGGEAVVVVETAE